MLAPHVTLAILSPALPHKGQTQIIGADAEAAAPEAGGSGAGSEGDQTGVCGGEGKPPPLTPPPAGEGFFYTPLWRGRFSPLTGIVLCSIFLPADPGHIVRINPAYQP